jgi:hypothetical protein
VPEAMLNLGRALVEAAIMGAITTGAFFAPANSPLVTIWMSCNVAFPC